MKKINLRKLNLRIFRHLPDHEKRITIPTLFTFLRILLTPLIVFAMIKWYWGLAFFLFVVAAFTDIIDGYLARIFNEKTFLGACIDPLADKFLILSCFFTLAFVETPLFNIPQWYVVLILSKEVTQLTGAAIPQYLVKLLRLCKWVLLFGFLRVIFSNGCLLKHIIRCLVYCLFLYLLLLFNMCKLVFVH